MEDEVAQMYHIEDWIPMALYMESNGLLSDSGGESELRVFCLNPAPPLGPAEAASSSCARARLEAR